MVFLDTLTETPSAAAVKVLVTDVVFAPGKPRGLSVANMLLLRRPGVRMVFVGPPSFEDAAKLAGEFVASLRARRGCSRSSLVS